MHPSLDTPAHFLGDVARAADVELNTLKSWLARKSVHLSPTDRDGEGSGSRRLLTLRTVYAIAITAHLVRHGLSPERSFVAAKSFTNFGRPDFSLGRHAPDGEAHLLVFTPAPGTAIDEAEARAMLVFVASPSDLGAAFSRHRSEAITVVNCTAICEKVDAALAAPAKKSA